MKGLLFLAALVAIVGCAPTPEQVAVERTLDSLACATAQMAKEFPLNRTRLGEFKTETTTFVVVAEIGLSGRESWPWSATTVARAKIGKMELAPADSITGADVWRMAALRHVWGLIPG